MTHLRRDAKQASKIHGYKIRAEISGATSGGGWAESSPL